MALGIQSHVARLPLSNTVELLDALSVQQLWKAIHAWVQKADLQPEFVKEPIRLLLTKR
jgi:hypothetical protein